MFAADVLNIDIAGIRIWTAR